LRKPVRFYNRLAQHFLDLTAIEMLAVSYVAVERRHGASWNGEDQLSSVREILASGIKKRDWVIHMLEDLGANSVSGPSEVSVERWRRAENVGHHECSTRNFLTRNRHSFLAHFGAQQGCGRQEAIEFLQEVALATAEIEDARVTILAALQKQSTIKLCRMRLRRIPHRRVGVTPPMRIQSSGEAGD